MKKILVVDDEGDIRLLVRTLLTENGYKVDEAANAKEGLEKLRKNAYDLAIIDFFMPNMSGRELLEKMRQDADLKSVKAIFLTVANLSPSGVDELRKLGCLDYIQKPIDNTDFLKRVKKALSK